MVGRGRKKGVRNKFKQVLLIEGHPDILYTHSMRSMAILNIGEQTFNIGAVSKDLYEHLKKIPNSELVISEVRLERTVGVEGFIGLHVRKAGENTTIEVSAESEDALSKKISKLKNRLEENGVPITERCSWVCTVDKGREHVQNAIKSDVTNTPEKKIIESEKTLTDDILNSKGSRKKKSMRSEDKTKKTKELHDMVARMGI